MTALYTFARNADRDVIGNSSSAARELCGILIDPQIARTLENIRGSRGCLVGWIGNEAVFRERPIAAGLERYKGENKALRVASIQVERSFASW